MSPETENKQKLESFFKEEYTALESYVGSRLRASASKDPEDIIQDVAFNLFAGADGYGPISNVAGFVYRSIKNKIVDALRKGDNKNDDFEGYEMAWIEFAELMYGNSTRYSEEQITAMKDALKNLPPPDLEIILAVDFEEYTFKEISEETGTPEGTLMSRRHRALAKLNQTLQNKKNL